MLLLAVTACGDDDDSASPTPSSIPASATTVEAPATGAPVTIGVFKVAQAQLLDDITAAFEKTVTDAMAPTQVTFKEQNANGDQSLITSIARDFASSDDDAFAVIGTPAVIALAQQVADRPIFAIAMGDPVGAGLATSLDAPGGNVTGSVDFIDPGLLVDQLRAIDPSVHDIGTVYEPSNQNMQVWIEALKEATKNDGLSVVGATISGTGDIAQGSRSLVGRADVILIGPDAAGRCRD